VGDMANVLTLDEARRIAVNVANLPRLLGRPAVISKRVKHGFRLLLIGAVLAFTLSNCGEPSADEGSEAWSAYRSGDYAKAERIFRSMGEEGDPGAQFSLGSMYSEGIGVPQDYAEAVKWYRLAAEQAFSPAQNSLGLMYGDGKGVPQDYAEAAKWYHLAAEQGDPEAQNNLGRMYGKGLGVPQNYAEAAKWYHLAAEQGDPQAQNNLGLIYSWGGTASRRTTCRPICGSISQPRTLTLWRQT